MKKGMVVLLVCWALGLLAAGIFSPEFDWLGRPLDVADRYQKADVVVAVSAGTLKDCRAHPNLFLREIRAAELVREGYSRSGKLIISGIYADPAVVTDDRCHARMAELLEIPPQALLIDNRAATTYENARNVAALMRQRDYRDAVLVTSRSHMFRASKSFERQGVTVYPVQIPDIPPLTGGWFDGARFAHLKRFVYEYGALIKYKWYGYI